VDSTPDSPETPERFEPPSAGDAIEGIDLAAFAALCRALVRAGSQPRRVAAVLCEAELDETRWEAIRAAWAERIRADPEVRAAFGQLYTEIE
jgi:hypothetical protein